MNTNVTMIPVAQLHPHPDNPRKDLGDITELTASIKANGVLQNLTVVPRANPDVNYEELCRRQLGRLCPRAYRLAGKAIFPQPGRNADYHDDAGRGSELPHPAGRLRSGTGRPLEPILAAHDMPALG